MKILGLIIAIIAVILLVVVHQILKHKGMTKKEEISFFFGYDLGLICGLLMALAWDLIF